MKIQQKALGLGQILAGLFLISPADEAIFTAGTGGLGIAAVPAQLKLTAAAGYVLILDGIRRINK